MIANYSVCRYHDICTGHMVTGHEGKCRHLHGHNYRIHFYCRPIIQSDSNPEIALDDVGRVIDFSEINNRLCQWLEKAWDHKFLIWKNDPKAPAIKAIDWEGVVLVDFNPTAENMAAHLVTKIGPYALAHTIIQLYKVVIEETAKCSASYEL